MIFLGMDIGTTNVKIDLYDEKGNKVAGKQFRTPRVSPQPNWFENEPDTLWNKLSEEVASLLAEDGLGLRVVSLAVSSQGETGLLVDADNNPLTPMIAWYDKRTLPLMQAWENRISADELFRMTGLQPHYIPSLPKLEWIRDHWPEAYAQADKWHCVSDYITRKICGVPAMDYSLASRTMAFDVERGNWSDKLLELAGIRPTLMPPLLPAGTPLGQALPEVAAAWGLSPTATIAVGAHDHPCGCGGLGADRGDLVVASIGTTESVCLYRETAGLDRAPTGYTVGRHALPGAYYWLGGIPSGGETIDWAIRTLLGAEPDADSYAEFARLAADSPPGSNGVLFLPQLKGRVTPIVDPDSRGGFWGLGIGTGREELCRAVIEGLAFEFRLVLEQAGKETGSVIAMGGGTKNALWMQCKADVLNTEVRVLDVEDSATFGAAMLGARAVGRGAIAEGRRPRVKRAFAPDAAVAAVYDRIYERQYKTLYRMQKAIAREDEA